ncbi:MAG TPA: fibronectin type III domain-containing protein [Candidatus Lokiarchaeia archaeon]|nr:fibronectin type III domain-containing protein [Candidatus Lokiarchaeia archaeon]
MVRVKIITLIALGIMLPLSNMALMRSSATPSHPIITSFPFAMQKEDYGVWKTSTRELITTVDHEFVNGSWKTTTSPLMYNITSYSKIVMKNDTVFNESNKCNLTVDEFENSTNAPSMTNASDWLCTESGSSMILNKTVESLVPAFEEDRVLPTDVDLNVIFGPLMQSEFGEPLNESSSTVKITYSIQKWISSNQTQVTTTMGNMTINDQFAYNMTEYYNNSGTWTLLGSKIDNGTEKVGYYMTINSNHLLNFEKMMVTVNGSTISSPTEWENINGTINATSRLVYTAYFPSAPLNLLATGGNMQVALSWQAPLRSGESAITGYNIYRSTSPGSETLLTTTSNMTTFTDTSVKNGQIYYYKITAVNATGEGALSNEACATPFASITLPSSPRNLQATAGNGQVTLSWQAPANNGGSAIMGYKIYRGSSTGDETYLSTIANVTTYMDKNVTNGQTYYYKISAVNGAGEGIQSSEASATLSTTNIMLFIIVAVIAGIAIVSIVTVVSVHKKKRIM